MEDGRRRHLDSEPREVNARAKRQNLVSNAADARVFPTEDGAMKEIDAFRMLLRFDTGVQGFFGLSRAAVSARASSRACSSDSRTDESPPFSSVTVISI
jgi:hypothetical protein